jgi:glycosyltransferase involved in cell wall biosynthesis
MSRREDGSRLRVLQVVDSLDVGGAERMAVNIANALASDGHHSFLCTTRSSGPLEVELSSEVGRLHLGRRSRWDISALPRFRRYLASNEIDVVHCHSTSLFFVAAALTFRGGPKIVWHDHYGGQSTSERRGFPYRVAVRRAAASIAVSEGLRQWAIDRLKLAPSRAFRISNFMSSRHESEVAYEFSNEEGPKIVCVAAFRPQKDHGTLLDAFESVVKAHPGSRLLLVGGGDPEAIDRLKSGVEPGTVSAVEWLGEREDVSEILSECHIGVLSSRSEAFPLALLEYGAVGLPVVATRVGDCPEILDQGRAGVLVPPEKAEALAGAIRSLIESGAEHRRTLGQNLHARVQAHYGRDQVMTQIVGVYRKALKED